MATVGFIGTGEIATALVKALAGAGHRLLVSERNPEVSARLAAAYPEVSVTSNEEVVAKADTVFLCLLAKVARGVLPTLTFRREQALISVMVDVSLAELQVLCAPAENIAITIPLPTLHLGGNPLPVYPDSPALRQLFADRALILPTRSKMALNAHFAACAMLSPLFDQLRLGSDWLGELTGDRGAVEAYLAALFGAYFRWLEQDQTLDFAGILQGLSTEGGLNATLRGHCAAQGSLQTLTDGLDGFRSRLGLPQTD